MLRSAINQVPENKREIHKIDLDLSKDDHETIKTLGLYWNAANDCFQFKINFDISSEKFTKRSTLSSIAKIFDPIGSVAPIITVAKNIMKTKSGKKKPIGIRECQTK